MSWFQPWAQPAPPARRAAGVPQLAQKPRSLLVSTAYPRLAHSCGEATELPLLEPSKAIFWPP